MTKKYLITGRLFNYNEPLYSAFQFETTPLRFPMYMHLSVSYPEVMKSIYEYYKLFTSFYIESFSDAKTIYEQYEKKNYQRETMISYTEETGISRLSLKGLWVSYTLFKDLEV